MIIGFTGTRHGLTKEQEQAFMKFINFSNGGVKFHHGDCVGADEQVHKLLEIKYNLDITIHPPTDDKNRAWCKSPHIKEPKEYLERNHNIVDETLLLIACPRESKEVVRSGTWATIRYARKTNKDYLIIYPDGSSESKPEYYAHAVTSHN